MARKGGKLVRSEVIQVRFDPKLKWAAELAASRERRTLSSFVEWAVEKACKEVQVAKTSEGAAVTAWDVAAEGWSLVNLARLEFILDRYPELLTTRERGILDAVNLARRAVPDAQEDAEVLRNLIYVHGWGLFCRFADQEIDQARLWEGILRLRGSFTRGPNGQWAGDTIES